MIWIIICLQCTAFGILMVLAALLGVIGGAIFGIGAGLVWAYQSLSWMLPFGNDSNDNIDTI